MSSSKIFYAKNKLWIKKNNHQRLLLYMYTYLYIDTYKLLYYTTSSLLTERKSKKKRKEKLLPVWISSLSILSLYVKNYTLRLQIYTIYSSQSYFIFILGKHFYRFLLYIYRLIPFLLYAQKYHSIYLLLVNFSFPKEKKNTSLFGLVVSSPVIKGIQKKTCKVLPILSFSAVSN